jgi:hypothetical protein
MEWTKFYYNGLETNIEVTRCGKVRRIKVEWMQIQNKLIEIDFNYLKNSKNNYRRVGVQIKGLKPKTIQIQQIIAATFLNYNFGMFPKYVIDHIDSNTINNNVSNLRVVTHRENTSKEKTSKTGLPVGVSFEKRRNKFKSQISINYNKKHLGYFNTPEEASNAYQQKLKELNNGI